MTEQAKVPAIRFAGFTDPWEQRKLGELVDNIDTGRSVFCSESYGRYPVLGSTSVIGSDSSYDYEGAFLLTARVGANAGNLYRFAGKVKISDNTVFLQAPNSDFLFYLLGHFDLRKLSFGTGQPLVRASELRAVEIDVPKLENEQKSIAEFFDHLDSLITLHQRKYDKLVIFKKSMLEKMFPKDGESVPEIRFAGFTDPWEQRKLGDVTDSFSGGTPDVSHTSYYGGSIPFIRSAEINSDKTELFLTEKGLDNSSAKIVERGTVLYALYGATSGEVGIAAIKGAINQAILALSPHTGNDPLFLASWLRREKARIVDTYLQGGQGNLSGSIVKELSFALPQQKEQQVIGSFFSRLDNLITLHQRKLELLQDIKKSLLDKMFV